MNIETKRDILEKTLALIPLGFHAGNGADLKATTQDPEVIRQWSETGTLAGITTARFASDEYLAVVVYNRAHLLRDDGEVVEPGTDTFRSMKAKGMFPRTLEFIDETHHHLFYRAKRIVRQLQAGDGAVRVFARALIEPQFILNSAGIANAPDWMLEGAKDAEPEQKLKYKAQSVAELLAAPPPEWLVRDLLPAEGLAVIYGEPGSGKSFLVLDILAAIARGEPWGGQRTKKGAAVYVGLEATINTRVAAYTKHHGLAAEDLGQMHVFQRTPLNLAKPAGTKEFITDLHLQGIEPALVVIDTLARALPGGDENSSTDMGAAIACAGMISREFNCLCVLVHHSGKDASRGARGHSSLLGAADAELAVSYDRNTGMREIRATKMKDGSDNVAWQFRLTPVDLQPFGTSDVFDEEAPRSLVVDQITRVDGRPTGNQRKKMTPAHQLVYRSFVHALAENGTECSHEQWAATHEDFDPLREGLGGSELRDAKKARALRFKRGSEFLVAQNIVRKDRKRPVYRLPSGQENGDKTDLSP